MGNKKKKNGRVVRGSPEFRKNVSETVQKRFNNPLEVIKLYQYHINLHPDALKARNKRISETNKKNFKLNIIKYPGGRKKEKLHKRINTYSGVVTDKDLQELFEE